MAAEVLQHPRFVASTSFRRTLTETRVREIAPSREIVFVYDTDGIVIAFKALIEKKILSMPVYKLHTEMCVGFIDILDILAFIVKKLRELGPVDPLVAIRTWHQLEFFKVTPVSEVINASGRDPYATIGMDASLQQCVDLMIERDVHRVGVLDHQGKVYNILTQTKLLQFVIDNEDKNVPFSLGPLDRDEIGHYFPPKRVFCVPLTARTIDAFVAMNDVKRSALAVTNEQGVLVSNLSASDLKEVGYDLDLYLRLFDTVQDFLKKKSVNRNVGPSEVNPGIGLPPPIFLGTGNKILQALEVFTRFKVHRIYLVQNEYRPIGVITPAEVLGVFSRKHEIPPATSGFGFGGPIPGGHP
jgi:CBS-domain-containing membrane protein